MSKYKGRGIGNLCRFFVYGTLRPGGVNHDLFKGAISRIEEDVTAFGYDMYSCGTYPAIIPCNFPNSPVTGTLITVQSDKLEQVLKKTDFLEGYDPAENEKSLYRRVVIKVYSQIAKEEVPTWVYIAGDTLATNLRKDQTKRIYHGNWKKHGTATLPSTALNTSLIDDD